MVTVLPSLAAIEPRSRVTGLCAMAVAAAMKATATATQPANRRMGVIGVLPRDAGLWHGSRLAGVYDCVMGVRAGAVGGVGAGPSTTASATGPSLRTWPSTTVPTATPAPPLKDTL